MLKIKKILCVTVVWSEEFKINDLSWSPSSSIVDSSFVVCIKLLLNKVIGTTENPLFSN